MDALSLIPLSSSSGDCGSCEDSSCSLRACLNGRTCPYWRKRRDIRRAEHFLPGLFTAVPYKSVVVWVWLWFWRCVRRLALAILSSLPFFQSESAETVVRLRDCGWCKVCAGPFPYETSLTASGIEFGISTSRRFDGTSIKQPTQTNWTASFSEHSGDATDRKTSGWVRLLLSCSSDEKHRADSNNVARDTQTVTVQYFTGSSSLTSYMVPGSSYLTFDYVDATPVFTS